jgi:hypothetical protein
MKDYKSLTDGIYLLLVLVDLEGKSFEGTIGKEIEIDKNNGKYKTSHFIKTLR